MDAHRALAPMPPDSNMIELHHPQADNPRIAAKSLRSNVLFRDRLSLPSTWETTNGGWQGAERGRDRQRMRERERKRQRERERDRERERERERVLTRWEVFSCQEAGNQTVQPLSGRISRLQITICSLQRFAACTMLV